MARFKEFQAAFEPSELAALQNAYDEACRELGLNAVATAVDDSNEDARADLAAALLEAARFGELDPKLLKLHALMAVNKRRNARGL